MDAATLLTRLAEVIDAHDWDGLPALLHDDFTCRLVHTGEVFDRDGWVRLNADYPGFQRMHVEDLVADGDRGVLRARVIGTDSDGRDLLFAVASFVTVRDDLVVELTEVWADVGQQAPEGTRPGWAPPGPTERLRFRRIQRSDVDDIRAMLVDFDPMRGDRPPSTHDDAVRWIEWQERNHAEHGFGLWVLETHDGKFIGDCGLTMQDIEGTPHVEVGYHLLSDWRGQGYATEAARAVRDLAAAHGVEHLVAIIRRENAPSQSVARNLGMELERTAFVHGTDALVFGVRLAR
ncbi:RimJ/RimL family protein N-acetyltransferase/ketosteroid isomerase-like protein [Nocardioides sp. BE266]|uniref:GNAT family N-acetyltransferase n=1 Tax=Nocardioides sp. BE266 TaxID=2817725 RepID=UPI002861518B|nr:GNAT family N-acetyltransferase [Nocardioides sp. BE266]MDR7251463.1 RimJ/RimL family protein N-acetyltransferase/ketosteroid isomerase-like protein [Nocardioides sp. BE266]